MLKNVLMLTKEEPNPTSAYCYYYPAPWDIPTIARGQQNITDRAIKPNPEDTLVIAAELEDARNYCAKGYAVLLQKENLTEATATEEFPYVTDYPCDCSDRYLEQVFCRGRGLPWEIARTEHLIIREITLSDVRDLYDIYEDELSRRFMEPLYPYEEEVDYQRDYIRNMYGYYGYGMWVLEDRKSGRVIGRAGIDNRVIDGEEWQELGYIVHRDYRGQGLAYEACLAILAVAKELRLPRLAIITDGQNTISGRLAGRLGFTDRGTIGPDGMKFYTKELS